MDRLASIFELRAMLLQLEHDVGLDDLSRTERDVLLAAHNLTQHAGDVVSSDQIRSHVLVEPVAQATYYRAIRNLLAGGQLKRASGTKARAYVVRCDLIDK